MKVGTDGVLLGAWAGKGMKYRKELKENERFEGLKRFEKIDEIEGFDVPEKNERFEKIEGFEKIEKVEKDEELRILDIGAGTGLISLILAQRFPSAHITAVEIDTEAASQCQENFEASPWADRLTIIPHSLADYKQKLRLYTLSASKLENPDYPSHSDLAVCPCNREGSALIFDLIVSNPPFYNATLKPKDEGRAIARHKDSLPIEEIASFAHQHLSANGQLALIYPTAYDSEVMVACTLHGMMPVYICDVLTKAGKPCKRRMASFSREGTAQNIIKEQLTIRDQQGQYTMGYRQLVDSLYLRLS